jgi:hypothetical protein
LLFFLFDIVSLLDYYSSNITIYYAEQKAGLMNTPGGGRGCYRGRHMAGSALTGGDARQLSFLCLVELVVAGRLFLDSDCC